MCRWRDGIKVSKSAYLPALRLGRWPEFDFGSLRVRQTSGALIKSLPLSRLLGSRPCWPEEKKKWRHTIQSDPLISSYVRLRESHQWDTAFRDWTRCPDDQYRIHRSRPSFMRRFHPAVTSISVHPHTNPVSSGSATKTAVDGHLFSARLLTTTQTIGAPSIGGQ